MEEFSNGSKRIYEITVKPFSEDRMIESYVAIKAFDKESQVSEVFVICRKEDAPKEIEKHYVVSSYLLGTAEHQDMLYYFIDIFEWMREKLLFMMPKSRSSFYADLGTYINQTDTSEKVKLYFNKWHQAHPL
jgi:hypothetical protein